MADYWIEGVEFEDLCEACREKIKQRSKNKKIETADDLIKHLEGMNEGLLKAIGVMNDGKRRI